MFSGAGTVSRPYLYNISTIRRPQLLVLILGLRAVLVAELMLFFVATVWSCTHTRRKEDVEQASYQAATEKLILVPSILQLSGACRALAILCSCLSSPHQSRSSNATTQCRFPAISWWSHYRPQSRPRNAEKLSESKCWGGICGQSF